MPNARGKSFKLLAKDIAEGYITVNPIFLKSFDEEALKELFVEITKAHSEIRAESFPHGDIPAIRERNLRLQRLYLALTVTKNFARERRMVLI